MVLFLIESMKTESSRMMPEDCRVPDESDPTQNTSNSGFICGVVEGFYGRPWTSEQRKKLFKRMNKMGMNTYIYAPKDDSKHRMYWRELYTVEEAELLTTLIEASEENNVTFVYALSPGLDMTYSSPKEVSCLKRKLGQVASFGCKAFALLFDDIETDMCETDKSFYQSFAHAQVSVTNEVYQHLHEPRKFFFCPTEYCASRAVPSVSQSEYLTTVGAKLLPGVDVMWTGPKVISRKITIKSIEEVSKALQRPPLIWDNIHANDYDQKRVFLGPYDGRSPELIPYLRGVLTNPNCEFESNFVALHTLAQWSKSNLNGVKKDCILSGSPTTSADIKLETDGEYNIDEDSSPNSCRGYNAKQALKIALLDWHAEFFDKCPTPRKVPTQSVYPVNFPALLSPSTLLDPKTPSTLPIKGDIVDPMTVLEVSDGYNPKTAPITPTVNSLLEQSSTGSTTSVSESTELNNSEPMDGIVTSGSLTDNGVQFDPTGSFDQSSGDIPSEMTMAEEVNDSTPENFTLADIALIVDLFYLPFEHGRWAIDILSEFHWLKTNAATAVLNVQSSEWRERSDQFLEKIEAMNTVIDKLIATPNKALVHELFPYAWDIKAILLLISAFVQWLALGKVKPASQTCLLGGPYSWGNRGYGDYAMNGDREPWLFRGGLLGEFQRMLPFESCTDLLFYVCPEQPISTLYSVRPYNELDKDAVYNICLQTCEDGCDGSAIYPGQPHLIADKLVGAYLAYSPEMCFIVEDEAGSVCGYVLAAADAKAYYNFYETMWVPQMAAKYEKPDEMETTNIADDVIMEFHEYKQVVPDSLLVRHPSIIRIDMLHDKTLDSTAMVRALACSVVALKVMGSCGIFSPVRLGDSKTSESYRKLGFFEIPYVSTSECEESMIHMGRII